MKTHCIHGHALTPENVNLRQKRNRWECRACRADEKRRHRAKKLAVGRWWEVRTVRQLGANELRRMAQALAHGTTITEFTSKAKRVHDQSYYRWIAWKHAQPKAAARFKRLSQETVSERRRAIFLARTVAAPALITVAPPSDMWAIIDSTVPRQLFSELRTEICQQLALDVLERRCECTVDALIRAMAKHRARYLRDYANPWGNLPLDAPSRDFDDDQTVANTITRGIWD